MAFGGATTSYDDPAANNSPIYGLQWQIDTFLASYKTVINDTKGATLVVVWAGANDFLQSRSPIDAANNVKTAITKLMSVGYKKRIKALNFSPFSFFLLILFRLQDKIRYFLCYTKN